MSRNLFAASLCLALLATPGCKSTYDMKHVSPANVQREGTIVFVRAKSNEPLQSHRRRAEVTHEVASRNNAGLLQVQVGLRNKSGDWLDLSIKTAFYNQPFGAPGYQTSMPIYETNWRQLKLPRGATEEYKVTCPKPEGTYYQVTVSELIR